MGGGTHGNQMNSDALADAAMRQMQVLAHRMLGRYPVVARWEQTDDVVQNAMLRLQRALAGIEAEDLRNFAGLVATQVLRELIDLARHHRSPASDASRHESAVVLRNGAVVRHAVDDAVARVEEPAEMEAWQRFHAAADALPGPERELFEVVWHLGLTQSQAAEVLGCSLRTVKRRWTETKNRLKASLGDGPEAGV